MNCILATMPLQQKVEMLQEAVKAKAIVLRILSYERFEDGVWGVIGKFLRATEYDRYNARKYAVDVQYIYVLEELHGEGNSGVWWVHDKADFIIFDSEIEFNQYRLADRL